MVASVKGQVVVKTNDSRKNVQKYDAAHRLSTTNVSNECNIVYSKTKGFQDNAQKWAMTDEWLATVSSE